MSRVLPLQIAVLTLLAGSIIPEARAEDRTFQNPVYQGYRLDYCKASGRDCGERVATAWCATQGFEYASDWGIDRDIGTLQPTLRLDNGDLCDHEQCDGFAAITCGSEESVLRMLDVWGLTRSTVFTSDRQRVMSAVTSPEAQQVVLGCSQLEPGVLLCESAPGYQHCRTLLEAGQVLGCRAALGMDGPVAGLYEATSGSYELSLRAKASVTVDRRRPGEGRIRGETRYRVTFAIPERAGIAETCLQRDRYEYHQTGPNGGSSVIYEADDCDEPLEGRFSPHEDDLRYAYGLCEGHRAWGTRIEATTDLVVAGIFHFTELTASAGGAAASRSVTPYLAIRAPLRVNCTE
jgi:hypothetical protein